MEQERKLNPMTIKSFTDIEQSHKLAEFLPIESSDMYWDLLSKDKHGKVNNIGYCLGRYCIYAWSLSALLSEIGKYGIVDLKILQRTPENKGNNLINVRCYTFEDLGNVTLNMYADNAIDACVEMVIKLHELKML